MTSVVFRKSYPVGWIDISRYTPEKLREIRKRKGVGRPPSQCITGKMLLWAKIPIELNNGAKNFAEWQRKPRKQIRA